MRNLDISGAAFAQPIDTEYSQKSKCGLQMSKSHRLILANIADQCVDGVAEISAEALAQSADVSLRTVRYAIKALIDAEMISAERGGGRGRATTYRLLNGAKRVQNCTILNGANSAKKVQNCTVSRARVPISGSVEPCSTSRYFSSSLRSEKNNLEKKKESLSFFSAKFLREISDPAKEALDHFRSLAPAAGWDIPKRLGSRMRQQLEARIADAGGFDEWCSLFERLAAEPDGFSNKFFHLLDELNFARASAERAPEPQPLSELDRLVEAFRQQEGREPTDDELSELRGMVRTEGAHAG